MSQFLWVRRPGVAGWFLLRVSNEVSFKIQSGLQSFEDLTRAGVSISKMIQSHGC